MSINPCNIHSQKFSRFLSEPLGNKMLDKLPGIGRNTFKKIQKTKQITKIQDLLEEFIEKFHSNHELFRLWLMKDFTIPEYRATECVLALMNYIEQAKRYHWSF